MRGSFLALDWGQKKVGYATADAEGIAVTPQGHFNRKSTQDKAWILNSEDEIIISKIIEDFEIEEIILGLPLHGDSRESLGSAGARQLALDLEGRFQKKVRLINEALTSWESKGSKNEDAQAAALLLEDYFSAQKRKKSTSGSALILLIQILLYASLLVGAYFYYSFCMAPMSQEAGSFIIDLSPGSSYASLRESLEKVHPYKNPLSKYTLKVWLQLNGFSHLPLRVGEYQIQNHWPRARAYEEVLQGKPLLKHIVVKEGFNIYDVQEAFSQERGSLASQEFLKLVKDPELIRSAKIPDLHLPSSLPSLEGFLFPETYSFTKYDSLSKIIRSMLSQFESRARPILEEHPWGKTPEGFYKLLILASIVEKESGNKEEQPIVASVFWNRIQKKMRLQSDPTTIYGLLPHFDGNIHKKDLLTPTPFNTYTLSALPATPISNPGETALKAVVHPAQTKHLYFVARGDGSHVFSDDFKTHDKYVDEFQRKKKH